ncbi:membrane protein involved in the export of O-antigen, teichoic acid lipoteichoic acids [Pseudoalteromonas sp. SW0106-04]|uniref:flippase n=1 Tax=Pseudoalteromonas sp. SW0106-04 TaxID=1702169 RepID=UPI0006B4829B|nr:flippase [Pseudoalteromonas sp. SW0106-04]GAP74579.1 membrane protein involved in the export of O-antigen, teichoic acid lipoteichoic acids [Pseudoalteromonas sp. SW0106-04]
MTRALKNTALLFAERIVTMAFVFASSIAIARFGGVELFGNYSAITAFAALFLPFVALGLNNVATAVFLRYSKHSHFYLRVIFRIRFLGAVCTLGAASILAWLVLPENQLLAIILVTLQSFTVMHVIEFFFIAQEKVQVTQRVRMAVISAISLAKILVAWCFPSLIALVFLSGLECVFIAAGYYFCYRHIREVGSINYKARLKRQRKVAAILLGRSKWLVISAFAASVYLKIDQLMLMSFLGAEHVAHYAAAAKLSEFWYVFPVLLANVLTAKLHRSKKQARQLYSQNIQGLLALMVILSLVIIIFTYLVAPLLVALIFGEQYQQASEILRIHIFACIFVFQRAVLSKWIIFERLYHLSAVTHGFGAVANVALNTWLIPMYAGVGAAWATVAAYAVSSLLALLFYRAGRVFAWSMLKAMCLNFFYWRYIRGLFRN